MISNKLTQLKKETVSSQQSPKEKISSLLSNSLITDILSRKFDLSSSSQQSFTIITTLTEQTDNTDPTSLEKLLREALNLFPGLVSLTPIDKNSFKVVYRDSKSCLLCFFGLKNFKFKQISFKLTLKELSIPFKKIKKTSKKGKKVILKLDQENLPPKNKTRSYKTKSQQNNKFTCKYNIMMTNKKGFHFAKKIIGSKGCNMKGIISAALSDCGLSQSFKNDNLVKLRLRGKGSGFKEGPDGKESNEGLQLCVSCKSNDLYKRTCGHVEILLEKILKSYITFMRNKRGVSFENTPKLYRKQEFVNN